MLIEEIINEIKSHSNYNLAQHHAGFFRTAVGQYGEGDLFYGLKVPDIRSIAKKYFKNTNLTEINELIKNPFHEVRLAAMIILIFKFNNSSAEEKEQIFNLYLNSVDYINNWDLVDISAPHIVGAFLFDKNTDKLWTLAKSNHLWSQRISVIATFYFIKQGEFTATLELSEYFLTHKHDLMHKAAGWMLREVGKRDIKVLYEFLDKFHKIMPRTMLRYSIEKFSKQERIKYMAR